MFEPFVLSLSKYTPPFDRLKAHGNLKLHKAESISRGLPTPLLRDGEANLTTNLMNDTIKPSISMPFVTYYCQLAASTGASAVW